MRTGDVGIRAQIQRSQTCADDTASGVSLWGKADCGPQAEAHARALPEQEGTSAWSGA
jgi:hypothetical protein